jgi:hypothetical protein
MRQQVDQRWCLYVPDIGNRLLAAFSRSKRETEPSCDPRISAADGASFLVNNQGIALAPQSPVNEVGLAQPERGCE